MQISYCVFGSFPLGIVDLSLFRYMDDAQIVESGTHEQLVAQGGAYAEIWQLSVASFLN